MAGRPQKPPRTPFEAHLRSLMAAAGIPTYKALAEKSEVGISTIQSVCSGSKSIGMGTATRLARALGVTIDKLMAGA